MDARRASGIAGRSSGARWVVALLSLFALACTAPTAKKDGARLVSADELPSRYRELWELYQAGGARWEAARDEVEADPRLMRFFVDNLVIVFVRSFDRSAIARTGEVRGPFERAQDELVRLQQASTPVLVELLAVSDGVVAYLASDTLTRIGVPALLPVAARLEDPVAETRRRAAELLGLLPNGGAAEAQVADALARRSAKDDAWIVRAQATQSLASRAVRAGDAGQAFDRLVQALADRDPAVVQSAAAGLRLLGQVRAVPPLARRLDQALRANDLPVAQALQRALRGLSGERRDLDAEAWMRWWQEHGAVRADSARAEHH